LKAFKSAHPELAVRRELNEPLETPDREALRHSSGPVGTRVQAVSGARELQPLFEVHTSRERFAVRRAGEPEQLGEIALDDTTISRPHGEPARNLRRVEVESLAQSHEPLVALVDTLKADCALESASDSKFSQGLTVAGLAPQDALVFASSNTDSATPLEEIALASLRRHLREWHLREPGTRLGDDPEALHDLRVAGRKIDAALRQFRAYLPQSALRSRPILKEALRVLGAARDCDVFLGELEVFSRKLSPEECAAIEPLKQHLLRERTSARERMLSTLNSTPLQQTFEELRLLLERPPVATEETPQPLTAGAVAQMVSSRYRKMSKRAARLAPESSMESHHAVRGRVKKLRYTLETVAAAYGKPAAEMLRALRRWQERLGTQQDAYVAGQRLQALASSPPEGVSPATLFLMGRLAEHYAASAAQARKRLQKAYRKVRRRWKPLRAKLREALDAQP